MSVASTRAGWFASFFAGATLLPVFVQLALALPEEFPILRYLNIFFFPLCALFLAGGALWLRQVRSSWHAIFRGLMLLLFLVAAIYSPLLLTEWKWLLLRNSLCLLPVALFYASIGGELGDQLKSTAPTHLLRAYAQWIGFAVLGGVCSDLILPIAGGNGLVVGFIFSCWLVALIPARLRWREAAIFVLFAFTMIIYFSVDEIIEDHRSLSERDSLRRRFSLERQESRWDRNGLFYLSSFESTWVGIRNLTVSFKMGGDEPPIKKARSVYMSKISGDDRALMSNVGAGINLTLLKSEAIGKNITALEADRETVNVVKALAWSGSSVIRQVDYRWDNERTFIESSREPFDWLIMEGIVPRYHQPHPLLLSAHFLQTPQAINEYFSRLKPDGVMVVELMRSVKGSQLVTVGTLVHSLSQIAGISIAAFLIDRRKGTIRERRGNMRSHLYLVASRSPERLKSLSDDFEAAGLQPVALEDMRLGHCWRGYSDDLPFLAMLCEGGQRTFTKVLVALLALVTTFIGAVFLFWRKSKQGEPTRLSWLVSLHSLAQTVFFVTLVYRFRSLWSEEILTFYILLFFTAILAAGGLLLLPRVKRKWTMHLPWFTFAVMLTTAVVLAWVPASKWNLLLVIPWGLFAGAQFGWAIKLQAQFGKDRRWPLACHFGAFLPAFLLLFIVLLNFGIFASFALSLVLALLVIVVPQSEIFSESSSRV